MRCIREVRGVAGEDFIRNAERFRIFLAPVEKHGVARLVFGEVVGVPDVFAVEVAGFLPVVALEVLLGELALGHGRVGLLSRSSSSPDAELGVNVEVRVGKLHVALRVVRGRW